ncbi:MAG: DUF2905 domain-containing protein [Anaerolineae bacterium]
MTDLEPEPKGKSMGLDSIGGVLVVIGLGVALLGGALLLASRVPFLNQLFNLPGDIRIQNGNFSCFFPIVSMIILSLLLTVIANIIIRLLNK